MSLQGRLLLASALALGAAVALVAALSSRPAAASTATPFVTGLAGGSGSTVGPDGALYVTETAAGRVTRVDPKTGARSTFADGLPASVIGLGGPMDVAFIGHTAYVLVTLVSPDVGGSHVDGIYRVDGPHSSTVVANIGAFALANPPATDFFVPTGLQYAMEPYHGGFLVTDGHHNRVYDVTLDGNVSVLIAFPNIVPTGLELRGDTVYMAEAGPVPHLPENGKVISFQGNHPSPRNIASGGRLLVDVESGKGKSLFALAQGMFPVGNDPGSPAMPNTGQLLRVGHGGTFKVVADGLNRPTSLEILHDDAYVVTLGGEIWKVTQISHTH